MQRLKHNLVHFESTVKQVDDQLKEHAAENKEVPNTIDQKRIDAVIQRYKPGHKERFARQSIFQQMSEVYAKLKQQSPYEEHIRTMMAIAAETVIKKYYHIWNHINLTNILDLKSDAKPWTCLLYTSDAADE